MHLYYPIPSKLKYLSFSRRSLSKECLEILTIQKIPKHIFVFTLFYVTEPEKIDFCSWFLTDLLCFNMYMLSDFFNYKKHVKKLFFKKLQRNILWTLSPLMHLFFLYSLICLHITRLTIRCVLFFFKY